VTRPGSYWGDDIGGGGNRDRKTLCILPGLQNTSPADRAIPSPLRGRWSLPLQSPGEIHKIKQIVIAEQTDLLVESWLARSGSLSVSFCAHDFYVPHDAAPIPKNGAFVLKGEWRLRRVLLASRSFVAIGVERRALPSTTSA